MSESFSSKIAWLGAVRRCTAINAVQRLVIEHIGDTADKDGRGARMSTKRVITELNVSLDTVKRARKAAEEHGLWDVVSKPSKGRPPAEDGAARAAEYRLTMPVNWCSPAPINDEKWCSPAPFTSPKNGAQILENGAQILENGAQTNPPSGISSGSSSGGRDAGGSDEPLDGAAVPDAGDAPPPKSESESTAAASTTANAVSWVRGPYGPRCRKHVNHPDPPGCHGCRDAREADEAEQAAAADRKRVERQARRDAIADCPDCDDYGQIDHGEAGVANCRHPNLSPAAVDQESA